MKFRIDKDIIKFMLLSLGIILAGILISLFIVQFAYIGFLLIISGIIGITTCIVVANKSKEDLFEDERSIRVREKAGYSSFIAILILEGMISALRLLKISPSLTPSKDASQAVLDIFIIGIWIFIVLRWYYNKKGE